MGARDLAIELQPESVGAIVLPAPSAGEFPAPGYARIVLAGGDGDLSPLLALLFVTFIIRLTPQRSENSGVMRLANSSSIDFWSSKFIFHRATSPRPDGYVAAIHDRRFRLSSLALQRFFLPAFTISVSNLFTAVKQL